MQFIVVLPNLCTGQRGCSRGRGGCSRVRGGCSHLPLQLQTWWDPSVSFCTSCFLVGSRFVLDPTESRCHGQSSYRTAELPASPVQHRAAGLGSNPERKRYPAAASSSTPRQKQKFRPMMFNVLFMLCTTA